jgi:hypothetical protein
MDFVIKTLVAIPVKHLLTICEHVLIFRARIEQTGLNTETGGYISDWI